MEGEVTCASCGKSFVIEKADIAFYGKMSVPSPTWCPECRLVRRLLWRNEYTFYKRKCQAPGHSEDVISMFSPDKDMVVYDQKFWWSDKWETGATGRSYDFSRPFFEQFAELMREAPMPSLSTNYPTMVRSDYSNWAGDLKDCYLTTDADFVEDSAYGSGIYKSKRCYDSDLIDGCEFCYGSFNLRKCYRTFFSVDCQECVDTYFSKSCVGCVNCFGCVNLRKKSYCLFNEEYPKEEYERKVRELWDGSRVSTDEVRRRVRDHWSQHPMRYIRGLKNEGSLGDYIYNTKRARDAYFVSYVEDSRFVSLLHSKPTRDCYDYTDWGENAERLYECMSVGLGAYEVKFSHLVFREVRNVEYGYFCGRCSDCFGCVGLKDKKYCILNRQYSREEYEEMLLRIKEHMDDEPYTDSKGRVYRYGEFFPPELSPFGYNETVAQEYFSLSREDAERTGYHWHESEGMQYEVEVRSGEMTDCPAAEDIVGKVIGCGHAENGRHPFGCESVCTSAFKIIPQEYEFLRQFNLPMPVACPRCRHYERIADRGPMRLWERTCQCAGEASFNGAYKNIASHSHGSSPCPNEFQTSYAPDREDIVYCEGCYQAEAA